MEKILINGGLIQNLKYRDQSFFDFVQKNKPNVTEWKTFAGEFIDQFVVKEDIEEVWVDNPKGYSGVLKGGLPKFNIYTCSSRCKRTNKGNNNKPIWPINSKTN